MAIKFCIFPHADPHPKSKEEKVINSKFVSIPYEVEHVEVDNENDLIDIICKNAWTPFLFLKYRRQDDFISTDLIAFDIDNGMTINEAEMVVNKLGISCLCLPSPSHTSSNERFRLVFPLSRTVYDPEEFKATYAKLAENFPVDPQCKDYARFYYGSTMNDGFWVEGRLYDPQEVEVVSSKISLNDVNYVDVDVDVNDLVLSLYEESRTKIPEQVDFFLKNAHTGLSGLWHKSFNSFIFTLSLQNVKLDNIKAVAEVVAPNELDKNDLYLLKRAYRDGQSKRDDL